MTLTPHRPPPSTRTQRPYPPGSYMRVRNPETLRAAKDERRLSYRQLSVLTGVSHQFLQHLIPAPGAQPRKKSCTPEVAERIALALGVPCEVAFSHRLPGDPSTGDLPLHREDVPPTTAPLRMPAASIDDVRSVRGRHRRKDQP